MKIAHIINPVLVSPGSDLLIAQPITFASMRAARAAAAGELEVELLTAQFAEDRVLVPADFRATEDLNRSILDFGSFRKHRKLPLIADILDRLQAASQADYCIYTNVDIAVMPYFYRTVARLLQSGFDALVINRRTISTLHTSPEQLDLMYAELGQSHPGRDCFIWRRQATPDFVCGHTCIGTGGIGRVLQFNLAATAERFDEFTDLHLTFHLGDERRWTEPDQQDIAAFNWSELVSVVRTLRERGTMSSHASITGFLERRAADLC
jgi:hypothetical protein